MSELDKSNINADEINPWINEKEYYGSDKSQDKLKEGEQPSPLQREAIMVEGPMLESSFPAGKCGPTKEAERCSDTKNLEEEENGVIVEDPFTSIPNKPSPPIIQKQDYVETAIENGLKNITIEDPFSSLPNPSGGELMEPPKKRNGPNPASNFDLTFSVSMVKPEPGLYLIH
jgi:hypothetical protein